MTRAGLPCCNDDVISLTVTVERSSFDVPSIGYPYPDRDWEFTDSEGNAHRWEIAGKDDEGYPVGRLPTLEWVVDCPDDGEYPEIGHYESRFTGEEVEPGYLHTGAIYGHVSGPVSSRINVTCKPSLADRFTSLLMRNEKFEIREFIPEIEGPCIVVRVWDGEVELVSGREIRLTDVGLRLTANERMQP